MWDLKTTTVMAVSYPVTAAKDVGDDELRWLECKDDGSATKMTLGVA